MVIIWWMKCTINMLEIDQCPRVWKVYKPVTTVTLAWHISYPNTFVILQEYFPEVSLLSLHSRIQEFPKTFVLNLLEAEICLSFLYQVTAIGGAPAKVHSSLSSWLDGMERFFSCFTNRGGSKKRFFFLEINLISIKSPHSMIFWGGISSEKKSISDTDLSLQWLEQSIYQIHIY